MTSLACGRGKAYWTPLTGCFQRIIPRAHHNGLTRLSDERSIGRSGVPDVPLVVGLVLCVAYVCSTHGMITVHDSRTGPAAQAEHHEHGMAVLHAAATLAGRVAWWWLHIRKGRAFKGQLSVASYYVVTIHVLGVAR